MPKSAYTITLTNAELNLLAHMLVKEIELLRSMAASVNGEGNRRAYRSLAENRSVLLGKLSSESNSTKDDHEAESDQ